MELVQSLTTPFRAIQNELQSTSDKASSKKEILFQIEPEGQKRRNIQNDEKTPGKKERKKEGKEDRSLFCPEIAIVAFAD